MYENAIDTIPKKYGKYYRTKNLKDLKTHPKDWWKYAKPLSNIRNPKKYGKNHTFFGTGDGCKKEKNRV